LIFNELKLLFCEILDYTVLLWDAEAALCLANYVGPDQHKQGVLSVVRMKVLDLYKFCFDLYRISIMMVDLLYPVV
jgi:hypothetical protein